MDADLLDSVCAIAINDPALLASPLARRLARDHCHDDPESGCAWLHGPRLAFRALGIRIEPGPTEQADLAGATLTRLAASHRRVLIAGASDYGLAAVLQGAYRAARANLSLMIADRCETPLRLVEWYARRVGLDATTVLADLTEIDDLGPFDLVCADAVLGQIDADRIDGVIAHWHGVLRPGGRVLAFAPVRGDEPRAPDSKRLAGMIGYARRAIAEGAQAGYDAFELVAALEAYQAHRRVRVFDSMDDMASLFARQGFAVEKTERRPLAGVDAAASDLAMILARRD